MSDESVEAMCNLVKRYDFGVQHPAQGSDNVDESV